MRGMRVMMRMGMVRGGVRGLGKRCRLTRRRCGGDDDDTTTLADMIFLTSRLRKG